MYVSIITGVSTVSSPTLLVVILLGVLVGMVIGSLPGLTATMGVALALPLTFSMEAETGILLLIAIYIGSIFGGTIAGILLRTPGTPAAAASSMDGYELTKQGKAGYALGLAVWASFFGGIVSTVMLILISPQLANIALKFSAPEMFALTFFGLTIIASVSGKSVVKGLLAGCLGLFIGIAGLDPMTSYPRYTFDQTQLLDGFDFIAIMIGLFAASQAFYEIEKIVVEKKQKKASNISSGLPKMRELTKYTPNMGRSSLIGTFMGIIPGAGADVAAFVSYNEAKRFSKQKDKFGKGNPQGVVAAESGNNGVTGGAMVPLLTLGIPGDAVAAVLLGALIIQGVQPGPEIFNTNSDLLYTIFAGMIIANIAMLVLGLLGTRVYTRVLGVSKQVMIPLIFMLCIIGSYSLNNSFFDVGVMFAAGIIGYLMIKFDFPAAPVVLALILGPMAESHLRRSLIMSDGSIEVFYTRPIAAVLLLFALLTILSPLIGKGFRALRAKNKQSESE